MKGYTMLTLLSIAVVLLTPVFVLPESQAETPDTSVQPTTTTPMTTVKTPTGKAVFKVKNTATGKIFTMDETTFLIAIVSCEMAPSSPTEALKAQTVAAYTYYCKQRNAAEDGVFSNVPDTFFTVGTEAGMRERWGDHYEKWHGVLTDVVEAVKGKQIRYKGELITACYHAISAGLTDAAADVWGGNYPYLQPADSAGDLTANGYESTVQLSRDAVAAALKKTDAGFEPDNAPADWFADPITTRSGLIKSVTVCGTTFTGGDLRTALGLRSACFTADFADGKFTFTVHGYGHNVGMSQTGAKYMANNGANYREILLHYYPGTTVG